MDKNIILHRQISGALKSTIAAHGPIHRKVVASASKRIIGALKQFENISYPNEELKERILELMARKHHDLDLLRKKIDIVTNDKKAHISGKASEIRRLLIELNHILKRFGTHPKPIGEKEGCQKE